MRQNILNPSKEVKVEGKMKIPGEDDAKIHIETNDGSTDYENIDISAAAALMGIGVIFLALIIVIFYLRQK